MNRGMIALLLGGHPLEEEGSEICTYVFFFSFLASVKALSLSVKNETFGICFRKYPAQIRTSINPCYYLAVDQYG